MIATAVNADNNVTLKNLQVDNVIPGAGGSDEGAGPYFIDFADFGQRGYVDLRINPGTLPVRTRLQILLPEFKTRLPLEKSTPGLWIRSRKRIRLPMVRKSRAASLPNIALIEPSCWTSGAALGTSRRRLG